MCWSPALTRLPLEPWNAYSTLIFLTHRIESAAMAAMKRAKKAVGDVFPDAVPLNGDGDADAVPLPVPFVAPGLEPVALIPYEVVVKVAPMVIDEVIVAVPDPDADKAEADIGVKMPDGTMLSAVDDDELVVLLDGVTEEDPVIKGAGVIFVLLVDALSTTAGWLGE